MFSPVDLSRASSSGRRSRYWPGNGATKLLNRRNLGQFLLSRRLTFLVIWTLMVIFFLYKALNPSQEHEPDLNHKDKPHVPFQNHQDAGQLPEAAHQVYNDQSILDQDQYSDLNNRKSAESESLQVVSSRMTSSPKQSQTVSTSTRKPSSDFARSCKVFILIVKDHESPRYHDVSFSQFINSESKYSSLKQTRIDTSIKIHNYIQTLIDILEAHRIEYLIDSIGSGLPERLLADQGDKHRFPIIVIDDLVKYMQLNRWARDQLNRHCKANGIGVISYLKNSGKSSVLERPAARESDENFPLLFTRLTNPAKRQAKRQRCPNNCSSSSTSWALTHKLNENSPILRTIKRKADIYPDTDLSRNQDGDGSWISMSSNHVTYEPITWAQLEIRHAHKSGPAANQVPIYAVDESSSSSGPGGGDTRDRNQRSPKQAQISSSSPELDLDRSRQTNRLDYALAGNEDQLADGADPKQFSDQPESAEADEPKLDHESDDSSSWPLDDDPLSSTLDAIELHPLVMYDRGLYDGIKRVIFGGFNRHWLNRMILLDSIEHLSSGRIMSPLERYIQIDVDDIFVGERGIRMKRDDVDALVKMQTNFAKRIQGGFRFNLGFSGKYFKHGSIEENLADEYLVEKAQEFTWFCHFWSHAKAHLLNSSKLIANELELNLDFAKQHRLPIIGQPQRGSPGKRMHATYAVAPHHSGVYPIHRQLYEAWRSILNVSVTSTEEFPHLRPAFGRRAFVHEAIKVLPRQTCGLYTHTIFRKKYPGGMKRLHASILGGELFNTILHNPVNIYMTHMSNYANDRLALYTFNLLFDFVQNNTNLQLRYAPSSPASGDLALGYTGQNASHLGPNSLADYYLELYPDERVPIWTNPCTDRRHLAIWAPDKHKLCSVVPKILIVGPQKTGTTALYTFLKMNPQLRSSQMSKEDFEEVQFFGDKHYLKGVDWYLERFQQEGDTGLLSAHSDNATRDHTEPVYLDKSATYFDDPKAPARASRLLPSARVVIMLIDPADRAYSWYQHMRAHGHLVASSLSFEQLLASNELPIRSAGPETTSLRNRCLEPGYYAQHLSRWLEFYPPHQVIVIDGQWFKLQPAPVMNKLQLMLRLEPPLDYRKLLVYNKHKGFYCQLKVERDGRKSANCLGKSKGRRYSPMSKAARAYLNKLYWPHNKQLARLLTNIGQALPAWLDEAMSLARAL